VSLFLVTSSSLIRTCDSSLASNNLTGTIPTQLLQASGLHSLYLASNPLCYSADYGTWAAITDYSPSMQLCRGCIDLCLNGGLCQAGAVTYTCVCPNGFTGQDCGTEAAILCSPGTAPLSSGVCRPCSAGTYSISGVLCVPCQKGTWSNVTAATELCAPCPAGTYVSSTNAIECSSCSFCQQMGSFSQNPYSPTPETANQTSVSSSNGALITATPTQVSGWIFVGILLGFVLLSVAIFTPLYRQTRGYISAISVILRTPFGFLRVVPSSWTIIEIPSFYRGLVALWVIAGLVC